MRRAWVVDFLMAFEGDAPELRRRLADAARRVGMATQ